MKKVLISILSLAFLTISCSEKETVRTVDYAIVSGKLDNYSNEEFTIEYDGGYENLEIKEDGSFMDTIFLEHPKRVRISNNNFMTSVYLSQGNALQLTFDVKNPKRTLVVSGKGVSETKYFAQRDIINGLVMNDTINPVFQLKPDAFYAKVENLQKTLEDKLATYDDISEAFRALEKKDLNIQKFSVLKNYADRQRELDENFELPQHYTKSIAELNYSDGDLYNHSEGYKSDVFFYYFDRANDMMANNPTIEMQTALLKVVKDNPNQDIKNDLASHQSQAISSMSDPKEFYDIFLEVSTNEEDLALITKTYEKLKPIAKGKPSPNFEKYENFEGGTTSLNDFRGNYMYIDIWATWCMPCIAEIPALKELEIAYHSKKIKFISISTDALKDRDKWKAFVQKKNLTGIQLFAPNSFESEFIQSYVVESIPRFILVDPVGNIVSSSTLRPSDPKLTELFDKLGI